MQLIADLNGYLLVGLISLPQSLFALMKNTSREKKLPTFPSISCYNGIVWLTTVLRTHAFILGEQTVLRPFSNLALKTSLKMPSLNVGCIINCSPPQP